MTALARFKEKRELSRSLNDSSFTEPQLRAMGIKARDTMGVVAAGGMGISFASLLLAGIFAAEVPGLDTILTHGVFPATVIFTGFAVYSNIRNIYAKQNSGERSELIQEIHTNLMLEAPSKAVAASQAAQ